MTDARQRRLWHRTGIWTAFGALTLAATAQGCAGCSDDTNPATGSSSSSGGTILPEGFTQAADGPSPFDTTPDPDGTTLYFTGLTADGTPGVFKVPTDGSNKAPTALAMGGAFTSPFGITIDSKGTTLFVADPGADTGNDQGAILTVPVGGGAPTPLAGTADATPRGVDIAVENGTDVLYFTGTDKSDGTAGVFSVPIGGGEVKTVFKSDPKGDPPVVLQDPSGIAVAKDGTIYVVDTVSSTEQRADIIAISGGTAQVVVSGIRVGYPCGIALNKADSTLLVSALDSDKLTDIVIGVDLASKEASPIAAPSISAFSEPAGLHRARNKDVFGWADSNAGDNGGSVFTVVP